MQAFVLRQVDDAHASGTDSFDDAVVGDPGANHGRSLRGSRRRATVEPCHACGVPPVSSGRLLTEGKMVRNKALETRGPDRSQAPYSHRYNEGARLGAFVVPSRFAVTN